MAYISKQKLFQFFQKNPIGIISTISQENTPHSSNIFYTINKDFVLYFITKKEMKKFRDILKNNHVSITITEPLTFESVQIEGRAEEIKDHTEMQYVIDTLSKICKDLKHWPPPISQLTGHSCILKVHITSMRYERFDGDANYDNDMFYQKII